MTHPPFVLLANGLAGARVLEHALAARWPVEAVVLNREDRQREVDRLRAAAGSVGLSTNVWSAEDTPADLNRLAATNPRLWLLSVYFAHLIPAETLDGFGGRAANVHPSLLPWGRGSHTNVWTLLDGEPAGVSLHLMTAQVDAGSILAQRTVTVHLWDTGMDLHRRLEAACAGLVIDSWPRIEKLLPGSPQEGPGSYHRAAQLSDAAEARLDDRPDADRFFRQLRAMSFPPHGGLRVHLGSDVAEARVTLAPSAESPTAAVPGNCFEIAGRRIGESGSVFVVAELSANHLGDLDRALALVRAAADAGADAVKLQTYKPDTITLDADTADFRLESGPWAGRTLYDLYAEAATPWEWHGSLQDAAAEAGLAFLSTPFDEAAVDFLAALGVPAFKIASFELVDAGLLKAVGRTGKPVILSTGLATMEEVAEAIEVLREVGCPGIALLHCTSAYPATLEDANLATIPALLDRFGLPVGLSDHTLDAAVPAAAAGLGACILEKHLTLRRADGGPDAGFSLEPEEFRHAAATARAGARARGIVKDGPMPSEADSLVFRRSLIAVRDIPRGARIERGWVRSLRPSIGLHPRHLEEIIGRTAAVHIARGAGLTWSQLEAEDSGGRES